MRCRTLAKCTGCFLSRLVSRSRPSPFPSMPGSLWWPMLPERAAHLAHLVDPRARPSYPVLWDADKQFCFAFEPTSEPHEEDYDDFQPENFPWENGLKLMPCEWRHHLHVCLPSRGFDRWRGDASAEPDQLHQWATSAPTVQEMSSMSRLSLATPAP